MKINHLKYFIEVVDSGNISVAAKKLYISQPNLSRSIKQLENSIGKKLLNRTARGVEATSVGKQVYFYAKSIQSQLVMLENLKNFEEQKLVSRLHISIALLFLKDDILLKFYNKINSIDSEISLFETSIEYALKNVINNKSEFAIIILNDHQLPFFSKMAEANELSFEILDKSPTYFHFHKQHPLTSKKKIKLSELCHYPYVHLPNDFFSNLNYSLEINGISKNSIQKTITINNYHSMLNMLNNTQSYILGNKWQIEELSLSSIVSSRVTQINIKQNFILVKRNREIFSESANIFLEILKESYGFL